MRLLLTAFFIGCILFTTRAQDTMYQKDWYIIDTLISNANLIKTAKQKVDELYKKAVRDKKEAQIIKALLYQIDLDDRTNDQAPNKPIEALKKAYKETNNEVSKAVLAAILAKRYNDAFQNNRWQIQNRKAANTIDSADINTWAAIDFHRTILYYYKQSITPKKKLQQSLIEAYQALIIKGNDSTQVRNLYGLLAEEMLDYLTVETHPFFTDKIIDSTIMLPVSDFITKDFSTADSNQVYWQAIFLYQQLLSFYTETNNEEALVRIDINRLEFGNRVGQFINKEKKYIHALTQLIEKSSNSKASIRAYYLLAENKIDLAKSYHPYNDSSNRWLYKEALELIGSAKKKYSNKLWEENGFFRLKKDIESKELSIKTEKINRPNTPFRALVSFRNADTIYTRIVLRQDIKQNINSYNVTDWKFLVAAKSVRDQIYFVNSEQDCQPHKVEINVGGLPTNEYAILLSTGKDFDPSKDQLSISSFQISDLIYFRDGNNYFVREYQNGKPVENASVTIALKDQVKETLTTNKNGVFTITRKYEERGNMHFLIKKGNSKLASYQPEYFYYTERELPISISKKELEKQYAHVLYYTDRSLYRPGQTIQFKGIALYKKGRYDRASLIRDKNKFWVYLFDANDKKIDSIETSLNDYGSFNGSFQIPTKVLTGSFSLYTNRYINSRKYFSVEEYKRPNFAVKLENNKKVFKLNDTAIVKGTVTAMAGNNLGGAQIKYTIQISENSGLYPRAVHFATIETITGITKSDPNGNFEVKFNTNYLNIDSIVNLSLTYHVTVTVTDNTGESRSISQNYSAVRINLKNTIQIPDLLSIDQFPQQIKTIVTDYNNNNVTAKEKIEIYKVAMPNRIIRARYWERPDLFIYSSDQFYKDFSADNYDDDLNKEKFACSLITSTPSEAGLYKIVASATDSLSQTVTTSKFVQLYDNSVNTKNMLLFGESAISSTTAEPRDTIETIHFYNSAGISVTRVLKRGDNHKAEYSFIEQKNIHRSNWIISTQDRGGIVISDAFVWQGRIYKNKHEIDVPFTNKELQIKYATYRNINEPGAKEKWTIQITGDSAAQKQAELLTAMYDASLDQHKKHDWEQPSIWNLDNYLQTDFSNDLFQSTYSIENYINEVSVPEGYFQRDILTHTAFDIYAKGIYYGTIDGKVAAPPPPIKDMRNAESKRTLSGRAEGLAVQRDSQKIMVHGASQLNRREEDGYGITDTMVITNSISNSSAPELVRIRTDFRETAFFYPTLYADSNGVYSFEFTFPDALTQWKWMSIAHTKDLSIGSQTATVFTQKQLMVQPNMPRFLREGDQIELSARIANQTNKELTGTVTLELFDPETNKSIDGWFQNVFPQQYFTVEAKQASLIRFPIQIPYSYNKPMSWRIVAKTSSYSDGEENTIPILANRTLVTESIPILLLKDTTQQIKFDKLFNNTSNSLTHQSLTVEYTSNPVWNVVKSLPYLMEYPYECAEQNFNRLYANLMAAWILDRNPNIRKILTIWKQDSTALKTNLEKNQTLKQLLIEETPWVLDAATEAKQQQQLANLFALEKLADQTTIWLQKMQELQLPNGAFPWFKGGWEDRFITNYIATGIGKLKRIGALNTDMSIRMKPMLIKALKYLDEKEKENYISLKPVSKNLTEFIPSGYTINYLYMRSFFRDIAIADTASYQFYYRQSKKYWTKQNNYHQSLLATVLFRNGEEKFAQESILPALLENTVTDVKLGLYWKNPYANYWYQEPIIQQAAMINCFGELATGSYANKYKKAVDAMRTWLILNKQTNNWKTTIATADACYALLANGSNWLNEKRTIQISAGNQMIKPSSKEEGTGYFSEQFIKEKVKEEMGLITIAQKTSGTTNPSPSYGAVYWQYFEALEKITPSATPLSITKKLFVEKMEKGMPILNEIEAGTSLQTGDKIVVQLIIKADRDMEYLHLKDMRAAAMEPENVLSGYRWQENLGFYESTRDASTNFFINYLPKGTHVFRYNLIASQIGVFSVGLASIQNMYAPEFTAHSQSFSLRVNEK